MFSENTLYYFFSTIAQVLAALIALIAVLVHFRINALKYFLIGDGKAILHRKSIGENGYEELTSTQVKRLSDAVDRQDIQGIQNVLKDLVNIEIDAGHTLESRPFGFQHVFGYFENSFHQINDMTKYSKRAFISALVTALYSTLVILLIEISACYIILQFFMLGICLILLTISITYVFKGINLAFKNSTNRFYKIK